MSSTSRYLQIRPDNIPSNGKVSFKNGFPVLSFTISAQSAVLDPRSIRVNGKFQVYSDNASPPTPVYSDDASQITMDSRTGIYSVMDQLLIRHVKSKQICEHIRHYNKYMNAYLGVTSSKQDLIGHLNGTCLTAPNAEAMFNHVVANGAAVDASKVDKSFSAHLPCGFLMSGNSINLMPNSFGGVQIEIHLSPDSNCLYSRQGNAVNADAHYELSDIMLTCEVHDPAPDDMAMLQNETEGALTFNTITSLYTTINTNNAQLQYNVGLKNLQSAFLLFCPANNINTITENSLTNTYPSNTDNSIAGFRRIQWLKGGVKYPQNFDVTTNIEISGNADSTNGRYVVSDGQLAKQFVEAIIPDLLLDRTSLSDGNLNREYSMVNNTTAGSYLQLPDGGGLFGLGIRYSQFNSGQDFSTEQFGVSLESELSSDNPVAVFIYLKNKTTLAWNSNGVQLLS